MVWPKTYIYAGPGAGKTSVRALERCLRLFGILRIARIDWRDLASLAARARPKNTLLCVPGGRDLPLVNRLRPQGVQGIRRFVERGGTYLGICSGAYLASANLEFAEATPFSMSAERPLRFFRGVARGPTHDPKNFSYHPDAVGCLVSLRSAEDTLSAYTLGGCALLRPRVDTAHAHQADRTVLARYGAEKDHAPAARLEKIGRGKALLVGLHLEWEKEDLPYSHARRVFGSKLEATRARRMRLFHGWLRSALLQ